MSWAEESREKLLEGAELAGKKRDFGHLSLNCERDRKKRENMQERVFRNSKDMLFLTISFI